MLKKPKKRGQILVEFIYVFPIMLVVLLAALDFTRIFTRELELNFAAYMGARVAAVHSGEDTTIVRKHIRKYSNLYSKLDDNNTKIELATNNNTNTKFIILRRDIMPITRFLWWDTITQVAVAPFMEESVPSSYITYKTNYHYRGSEAYNGKPIIKSLAYKYKDNFARHEATFSGSGMLNNLLPSKWYPQTVITSSARWLAALKGEAWPPYPMLEWWGDAGIGGIIMNKPSKLVIDAMIFRRPSRDNPLTRRYTGFLVGYGKVSFSGGGISPRPSQCWETHTCGPAGYYNAYAANPVFWGFFSDYGASHHAFAYNPCRRKIIVCTPFGCHCVWCVYHKWTRVTHYISSHAGGNMWERNGRYWNFYNAVWALAALPEVYATSVYHANYWNIEGDCWHNCWSGKPDYAPNVVNGMSGFKDYLNQLEKRPPYDEQQTWCDPWAEENR